MVIYLDTSAIIAILDEDDKNHEQAATTWLKFISEGQELLCNNYIVVEATSLIQNRYGMETLRRFHDNHLPLISIEWMGEEIHEAVFNALLEANRRKLSFVDCSSFETMRRLGIETVFTFDEHFKERGFQVVP